MQCNKDKNVSFMQINNKRLHFLVLFYIQLAIYKVNILIKSCKIDYRIRRCLVPPKRPTLA